MLYNLYYMVYGGENGAYINFVTVVIIAVVTKLEVLICADGIWLQLGIVT